MLSKIFEQCILARYSKYFLTSSIQFSFKKRIWLQSFRLQHYVSGGSTVNVCLLDLSKAFDKMNHFALYNKLMNRSIPVLLMSVLENWFSFCISCVNWGSAMSYFYELKTGVRQGGRGVRRTGLTGLKPPPRNLFFYLFKSVAFYFVHCRVTTAFYLFYY